MNRRRWSFTGIALLVAVAAAVVFFGAFFVCRARRPAPPDVALATGRAICDEGVPAWCGPHPRQIAANPAWESHPCPPMVRDQGGHWRGSLLFTSTQAKGVLPPPSDEDPEWANLPPALRRYCAYAWVDEPAAHVATASSISSSGGAALNPACLRHEAATRSPDCHVSSPIDSFTSTACSDVPGRATTCPKLLDAAKVAIDLPRPGMPGDQGLRKAAAIPGGDSPPMRPVKLDGPPAVLSESRVTVAVLDTNPTGAALDANAKSPHGNAVAAIVRGLACPGASSKDACKTTVVSQLALPELRDAPNYVDGGSFGSLGEIAVAVWSAAANPTRAAIDPLVVNMSLGWEHRDDATLTAAESAVKDAITFANCRGALVLAAAGNRRGAKAGDDDTGPLYPAAWEREQEPTATQCAREFHVTAPGRATDKPGDDVYARLLYAVGGVDLGDQVLANARDGGRPRLAAYATAVSFPGEGTGHDAPLMTGTSVATAMASGVAAATWATMPGATASKVMAAMYESAVSLDVVAGRETTSVIANFPDSVPAAARHVRRLSLCRAVLQCRGAGTLADLDQCPCARSTPRAYRGAWPAMTELLPATPPASIDPGSCANGACGDAQSPGGPRDPSLTEAWGNPQPNGTGCDSCMGEAKRSAKPAGTPVDFVVNAQLESALTGLGVVTIVTDANQKGTPYTFKVDGLSAFQVTLDAGTDMVLSATLSTLPADGGAPTYDPILVVTP